MLPLINLVAPGFLCLVFFFLLFMNKDCRQIWKGCFGKCKKICELCKPPPTKLRAETDRSRCSSTLSVLFDRRLSDPHADSKIDPVVLAKIKPYLFPSHAAAIDSTAKHPRSSTLSLPATSKETTVSQRNSEVEILVTPPPNDLEAAQFRSHSLPVLVRKELGTQATTKHDDETILSKSLHAEDALECSISENSDVHSETETFVRKPEECSTKL